MYFNDEDIKKAKNVDLIGLLEKNGFQIKKERNANKVLGVDGGLYIFDKNNNETQGFYWHKHGLKGNGIELCKVLFNDNYLGAIKRLLCVDMQYTTTNNHQNINNYKKENKTIQKDFKLPQHDENYANAVAYLSKTRKINNAIINDCIKKNIIKQFRLNNFTYVGFVGYDKSDTPKYLMLRSCNSNSNFKKEYENSSKAYGFKIFDNEALNNKVNIKIFESPIDLLSYRTLYDNESLKDNIYLSMGGVSDLCLEQFIKDYEPNINKMCICFDNDEAGQTNANKLKTKYQNKYKVIIEKSVIGKDYNEQLVSIIQNETSKKIVPIIQKTL